MKAMLIEENKLVLRDVPEPVLKPGYVIIDIHAAALNRADLLQVAGKYPPPPGWPEWPGLECSGVISAAAENSRWKVGDKVCALLGGGGYAEKVLVPEGMVMPIPDNVSFTEAAALPEVYNLLLRHPKRAATLANLAAEGSVELDRYITASYHLVAPPFYNRSEERNTLRSARRPKRASLAP